MKTIAVSIDEATIRAVDDLAGRDGSGKANRSAIVREALAEYLERRRREARESEERRALAADPEALARELEALVEDQATL